MVFTKMIFPFGFRKLYLECNCNTVSLILVFLVTVNILYFKLIFSCANKAAFISTVETGCKSCLIKLGDFALVKLCSYPSTFLGKLSQGWLESQLLSPPTYTKSLKILQRNSLKREILMWKYLVTSYKILI